LNARRGWRTAFPCKLRRYLAKKFKHPPIKLKSRGALAKCLAKKASDVIAGEADASSACRDKFTSRIAKVDRKAAKAGTSCRIMDNHDDTLTDLDTGLMREAKTGNMWFCASGTSPDVTTFTAFLNVLDTASSVTDHSVATPCFAGHCERRLRAPAEPWRLARISRQAAARTARPICSMWR